MLPIPFSEMVKQLSMLLSEKARHQALFNTITHHKDHLIIDSPYLKPANLGAIEKNPHSSSFSHSQLTLFGNHKGVTLLLAAWRTPDILMDILTFRMTVGEVAINPFVFSINEVDGKGNTLLHYLTLTVLSNQLPDKFLDAVNYLLDSIQEVNPFVRNREGLTLGDFYLKNLPSIRTEASAALLDTFARHYCFLGAKGELGEAHASHPNKIVALTQDLYIAPGGHTAKNASYFFKKKNLSFLKKEQSEKNGEWDDFDEQKVALFQHRLYQSIQHIDFDKGVWLQKIQFYFEVVAMDDFVTATTHSRHDALNKRELTWPVHMTWLGIESSITRLYEALEAIENCKALLCEQYPPYQKLNYALVGHTLCLASQAALCLISLILFAGSLLYMGESVSHSQNASNVSLICINLALATGIIMVIYLTIFQASEANSQGLFITVSNPQLNECDTAAIRAFIDWIKSNPHYFNKTILPDYRELPIASPLRRDEAFDLLNVMTSWCNSIEQSLQVLPEKVQCVPSLSQYTGSFFKAPEDESVDAVSNGINLV
ncbi:MAG: hypothetical protein WC785_09970 [Tatlockia sp.]|jgi:hypothetical protein